MEFASFEIEKKLKEKRYPLKSTHDKNVRKGFDIQHNKHLGNLHDYWKAPLKKLEK